MEGRRARGAPGSGLVVLGLDHRAHPSAGAARGAARRVGDQILLGDRVVFDEVAADLVATAGDARPVEQARLLGAAVVLDALGLALDVFIAAFALLAEGGETLAGGGG